MGVSDLRTGTVAFDVADGVRLDPENRFIDLRLESQSWAGPLRRRNSTGLCRP